MFKHLTNYTKLGDIFSVPAFEGENQRKSVGHKYWQSSDPKWSSSISTHTSHPPPYLGLYQYVPHPPYIVDYDHHP